MRTIILCLFFAAFSMAPVLARQVPPDRSPPADMQQPANDAHSSARAGINSALSPDHQSKVASIIDRVKSGRLTDARDAAKQIDAILTPDESRAVLAVRDQDIADMRAGRPDPGPPGDPSGPLAGGRQGGTMFVRRGMRTDAGFAILMLSLDREQLHALFSHPN